MAPFFESAYSPFLNGAARPEAPRDFGDMSGAKRYGPESGMAVPHVLSMQAVMGSAWQTYFHGQYDEAIRDSQANADAMRNDPFIRRLVDERKHAVCSLKASIEVDNERDPWQKAMKDSLTQQWKSIPNSYDLNWYMLEAEWYGRYGAQFSWMKKNMDLPALPQAGGAAPGLPAILGAPSGREKRQVLAMRWHIPYEGDKIGYDYEGCPYVLVSSQAATKLASQGASIDSIPDIHARSMEYGYTTAGGKALFLRTPSWRQRFAIHAGEILDSPFLNAEQGDQIHGVGIRSVIYWYWWLRDEFLSNVSDWCARVGNGVRVWYYDAGNPASEAAIDQAARDQSNQNVNIKIPRTPGSDAQEGVEFIDTSSQGSDLLLRLVQHVEEHIQLYVVGQSMSQGSQENNGSGFGDRGRADFAVNTKWQITKRSATKYGDTMTNDVLSVMKQWSFPPDLQEIPARVVYSVDTPDVGKYMDSVKTFCDLGGKVREESVRNTLGLESPHEGDAVLGGVPQPAPGGQPGASKPAAPGAPAPETTGTAGPHLNGKPSMNGHDRFQVGGEQ